MDLRSQPLIDSVISLEMQAKNISQAIHDGRKRWGGSTAKAALADTCKSMAKDLDCLERLIGKSDWIDSKRKAVQSFSG